MPAVIAENKGQLPLKEMRHKKYPILQRIKDYTEEIENEFSKTFKICY